MRKLFFLFISSFFFFYNLKAQDSCGLRISLLTCAPGDELYSIFGHTALRVQDASTGIDDVYNYGTFEFSPEFYSKFIRGKLLYYLSVENFNEFIYQYQHESRSIVEQVLNLSCTEKEKLFTALKVNALDQNKYYLYDFLFDNCTTRARDIISKNTDSVVTFKNILPSQVPTFRNQIHSYLDRGGMYWSKLGIDLLLGARLDKKVSNIQSMFLPDYLLKGMDSAYVRKELVQQKVSLLQLPSPIDKNNFFTPFVVFSLLLLVVTFFTFRKSSSSNNFLKIFDVAFFTFLGLAGLLILFMWFGTDHKVTQENYNLLWAIPFHIAVPFILKRNFSRTYFTICLVVSVLLLLLWFFLPQQMNNAVLPILLINIIRSWALTKKKID